MSSDHDMISIGVAAALAREYAQDNRAFVPMFANMLVGALPEQTEPITSGGFLSKKSVTGVKVTLGDYRYELDASGKGAAKATRTHIVRGIALKSEPVEIHEWLQEVGAAIETRMEGNARARTALNGMLGL